MSLCYVVTDIETDGPEPGRPSMLSFASVAVDGNGEIMGQFEACLQPLPGATSDPGTLEWLQGQPAVWADATRDPQPPGEVMQAYAQWVHGLSRPATFVAHLLKEMLRHINRRS